MVRLILSSLLLMSTIFLLGCPAKDWMKREDSYLSVEQYKIMTQVVSINDKLYRVKRGEEINQNRITQLFINFQTYVSATKEEQQQQLKVLKNAYISNVTVFNSMSYALVLLEAQSKEREAYKILSQLDYSSMNREDQNLFNLAQILQGVLKSNKQSRSVNANLNKKIGKINKQYDLVREEMVFLNKQVNALKNIEESIHSREVGLELGSR